MVYRRHSGVQDRLKAIPNQSNVKAMKVCIVLIIRRFVFQVQKNTFQGKIHTYNRNAMCYFFYKIVYQALDQRNRRYENKLHIKHVVRILGVQFGVLLSLRITSFEECNMRNVTCWYKLKVVYSTLTPETAIIEKDQSNQCQDSAGQCSSNLHCLRMVRDTEKKIIN